MNTPGCHPSPGLWTCLDDVRACAELAYGRAGLPARSPCSEVSRRPREAAKRHQCRRAATSAPCPWGRTTAAVQGTLNRRRNTCRATDSHASACPPATAPDSASSPPGLGRILLKAGKAEIDQRMPCHMRITCPHAEEARRRHFAREEDAVIGVDPGYKTTGLIARIGEDVVFAIEIEHRTGAITENMGDRAGYRRGRRGRRAKRQRRRGQPPKEARFSNRRRHALWLPPALRHLRNSILCWVRWLVNAYGGRIRAVVESAVFDPHLLRNPDVSGAGYQEGPALSQPPVPRALRARRAPVRLLREEEQGARVRPRRAESARRERQLRQPSAGMPAGATKRRPHETCESSFADGLHGWRESSPTSSGPCGPPPQ